MGSRLSMDILEGNAFIFLAVTATFFVAGFVKGVIGLGLPTLAMGLLGAVMPPAQAASILVVPSLVTNFWQLAMGPSFVALVRRLWTMMAGVCVGTWAGAGFLTGAAAAHTQLALALIIFVYGCMGLAAVRFRVDPRAEPWLSPLVGLATGFLTGATGVFVIPAVPYIQALDLEKEQLVQALALSPTVSALALGASLASKGAFGTSLVVASALAVAPALAGMYAGQWLRLHVSVEIFRRIFFFGLVGLGVYLGARAATP